MQAEPPARQDRHGYALRGSRSSAPAFRNRRAELTWRHTRAREGPAIVAEDHHRDAVPARPREAKLLQLSVNKRGAGGGSPSVKCYYYAIFKAAAARASAQIDS